MTKWYINDDESIKSDWSESLPPGTSKIFAEEPSFRFDRSVAGFHRREDAELAVAAVNLVELAKGKRIPDLVNDAMGKLKNFSMNKTVVRAVMEELVLSALRAYDKEHVK